MDSLKTYLALDYGEKRIGVAIGNSVARLARPLTTLPVDGSELSRLADICQKEKVDALVIGLPRGLGGNETVQTKRVRLWADKLKVLGLKLYWQDEAGTTIEAERHGGSRQGLDAAAAAVFLQDFLNQLVR